LFFNQAISPYPAAYALAASHARQGLADADDGSFVGA
jgi:hypothetical protein